ncbi:hypothetical protein, partial [Klebsiella pneumoniae]
FFLLYFRFFSWFSGVCAFFALRSVIVSVSGLGYATRLWHYHIFVYRYSICHLLTPSFSCDALRRLLASMEVYFRKQLIAYLLSLRHAQAKRHIVCLYNLEYIDAMDIA